MAFAKIALNGEIVDILITDALYNDVANHLGISTTSFAIYDGIRRLDVDEKPLNDTIPLRVRFLCLGGKGGFGSLLKRKGMKVKIHNYQSSRDLSGRRIRDNEAIVRAKAIAKQEKWESSLIKALGGADPFAGQRMSAVDCIQTYKIRLHPNTPDPFAMIEEARPQHEFHFTEHAAQCMQYSDSIAGIFSPQLANKPIYPTMDRIDELDIEINDI